MPKFDLPGAKRLGGEGGKSLWNVATPIAGILVCVLLATHLNMDHVMLMLVAAPAGSGSSASVAKLKRELHAE